MVRGHRRDASRGRNARGARRARGRREFYRHEEFRDDPDRGNRAEGRSGESFDGKTGRICLPQTSNGRAELSEILARDARTAGRENPPDAPLRAESRPAFELSRRTHAAM